jgi:hypothetical protein
MTGGDTDDVTADCTPVTPLPDRLDNVMLPEDCDAVAEVSVDANCDCAVEDDLDILDETSCSWEDRVGKPSESVSESRSDSESLSSLLRLLVFSRAIGGFMATGRSLWGVRRLCMSRADQTRTRNRERAKLRYHGKQVFTVQTSSTPT